MAVALIGADESNQTVENRVPFAEFPAFIGTFGEDRTPESVSAEKIHILAQPLGIQPILSLRADGVLKF